MQLRGTEAHKEELAESYSRSLSPEANDECCIGTFFVVRLYDFMAVPISF